MNINEKRERGEGVDLMALVAAARSKGTRAKTKREMKRAICVLEWKAQQKEEAHAYPQTLEITLPMSATVASGMSEELSMWALGTTTQCPTGFVFERQYDCLRLFVQQPPSFS